MAETQTPVLTDEMAKQAWTTLYDRVYAPQFFTKLAQDYGIQPSNHAEQLAMLRMAGKLRVAYESDQQQKVAAGTNLLGHIEHELDRLLGTAATHVDKQAATQTALDPAVAEAVLMGCLPQAGQQPVQQA